MIALWVALAGGCGAAARFLVDELMKSRLPGWSTAVINVSGSAALGALIGTASSQTALILGTGLLGGYTTFSAASLAAAYAAAERRPWQAAAHTIGMAVACVAAAALGAQLA